MRWHGEFAFGEVWLAFRGASADNRFHSHAAVQLVAGGEITVADAAGREFVGPGWLVRSGVRHCLRPAPAMLLVLLDPQSHLAAGLLDALVPDPIAPLPSDLGKILQRFRRILVPELNLGQLVRVIRAEYLVDAVGFNRVRGLPLASQEIYEAINQLLEAKR